MRANLLVRAVVAASVVLVAVPLGAQQASALRDGSVLSWGRDTFGQLGDDATAANKATPVGVSGLGAGSGVVAVAAGFGHSLALRADASVVAWGYDADGQLGDAGGNVDQPTPVPVTGLGAGSGVVAVAAGAHHSLALKADGSVLSWGRDDHGQLGDGGINDNRTSPVLVSGLGPGSGVIALAGGNFHSLALRADGSVLSWGRDIEGQLGDGGIEEDRSSPVQVSGLGAGSAVAAIAAGGFHSLAVRADGSVVAWGYNGDGQLGNGGTNPHEGSPVAVSGLGAGSGVVGVAAGIFHSLAVRGDGSVLSWGDDFYGQLGNGGTPDGQATPVAVTGLGAGSGVVAVAAGDAHSVALRGNGSVLTWGRDDSGQLGDGGTNSDQTTPVDVTGLGVGSGVTSVAAGDFHNLVARAPTTFSPLSPARVWDSRSGPGPMGRVAAGAVTSIPVTGAHGVPATGVSAVVLNVTAAAPTARTFVTVWPAGEPRPLASNLNLPPGDDRANLVTVKVGIGGMVSFFSAAGTVDLIVDVAGWYGPAAGQRFTSLTPGRLWDSRTGPGPVGRVAAGATTNVVVTGAHGVPPTGVSAVVLNVTATGPTSRTFVTAWPTGEVRPLASNLNIPPGDDRANLVTVKVGAGGMVSFYSSAGTVDLVADVAGYFGATGSSFTAVSPGRVWDSRVGPGPVGRVVAGTGGITNIPVTGAQGVPNTGVTAVLLNVTAAGPTARTFVTVWPAGEARPLASTLNVPPGDDRANLASLKVGADGQVSFYDDAGTVDLIADVAGWYGPTGE
jgi:alpha-tubulin suppressor-like RCC1 family protein/mRNA-degrading endonuclease toxin of MazEF toxin-antitoxin module